MQSPSLFFEIVNSYQKTAAIKAAIDLDLFTMLGESPATAAELASRCNATARGARILADFLTILGFLEKTGERYQLTADSAAFLNRRSPQYAGRAIEFLLSPQLTTMFEDLASTVRQGGPRQSDTTVVPEHPVWIHFARSMGPLMVPAAQALVELLSFEADRDLRILDVSASHGMFGLSFARKYPRSRIVALDAESVLEVARENARAAGVVDRFSTISGDAFEVDLGTEYDAVLIPNFLHHFDLGDGVRFLKRVHSSLRSGGRVAIVEFVPNPDRVTPPSVASFAFVMLGTTPGGDAYTFGELAEMLQQAGFHSIQQHPLDPSNETAVIATKA
jgi:2-polyprenyl-3-methyl-5-hydroxy-6-metoxy-1,4-benzoquinol methylase